MNLLVLSDLHMNSHSQTRNAQFIDFIEKAHRNKDELLIVGDLFELWFGWPRLTFEYQRPIVERMKELAADGLAVDYVEGNHDFGISRYEGTIFRSVSKHFLDRKWQETHLHVEHGDLINKHDLQYRAWRSISKNALSFFLLEHIPASFLLKMTTEMEKRMKSTNLRHKMYYPEESCRKLYLDQFEKGADIVIVGHFHIEREVCVRFKDKNVLFYNLPGWEQGFRYLVIPQGNEKPYFTEWGRENGNSSAP